MPTDTQQARVRSHRMWLVAAVCLAAVLQSVLVATSPAVALDGITFVETARGLRDDPVRTMQLADQHPGYPAMLLVGRALVTTVIRPESVFSWVWGGRVVSGLFGLATVVAAWLLVKRTFNETVAGIAVIFVAVLPAFRQSAADVLSDTPHLFFYVLATWLALEGMRRVRWPWFLGAGLACGCAYWIRPEGLSVAAATAVAFPLVAWRRRHAKPLTVVLCLAVMLAAAAAVACPYWILTGKLTSKATTKPHLTSAEHRRDLLTPSWRRGAARDEDDLAHVRLEPPDDEPPWQIVTGGVGRLIRGMGQSLRWVLLLPLASGLIGVGRMRPHLPGRLLITTLLVVHLLLVAWVYYAGRYISERHLMVPTLLVMPWVASGCTLLARRLSWLPRRRRPEKASLYRGVALGVVVLVLAASMMPRTLRALQGPEIPVIEAALCLRQYADESDAVLTNTKYVLFYSCVPGRLIGDDEPGPMLKPSAAGAPYRFVVIDRRVPNVSDDWRRELDAKYKPYELPGIDDPDVQTLILR